MRSCSCADGKPALIAGPPSADCPDMPSVPDGTYQLANVYRPFNAPSELRSTFTCLGRCRRPSRSRSPLPSAVRAKLRKGQAVTIVCWGDSVTAGGEASTPAKNYVGLLESMLKQRYPSATIKVVNAGIGGDATPWAVPQLPGRGAGLQAGCGHARIRE